MLVSNHPHPAVVELFVCMYAPDTTALAIALTDHCHVVCNYDLATLINTNAVNNIYNFGGATLFLDHN